MPSKRSQNRLKDLLRSELGPGEGVALAVFGEYLKPGDWGSGPPTILAMTDRRVVGVVRRLTGAVTISWPFDRIVGVASERGRRRGVGSLAFTLPGDGFRLMAIHPDDAEAFRNAVEARLGSAEEDGAVQHRPGCTA